MIKAVVIAMVLVVFYLVLQEVKKAYSAAFLLAGCLLLFFLVSEKLSGIFSQIQRLAGYLSMKSEHFGLLLKIIGVAYLSELSSGLCKDAGLSALAGQVELIGKLTILGFSIPVVLSLFEAISQFFS